MTEHSDHILLTYWYRNHNAEAFRVLASRHAQMVYATALRVLKNPTEAEDIAQESFLELASTSRPPKRNAGAWLHKITYHKALNYLRTAKRRQARDKQYVRESDDTQTQEWNDVKQHLDAILSELPEKYREPIVLYFFEEQQQGEIAESLKVSRQTVTHRIAQGVDILRTKLAIRGITVPAAAALIGLIQGNATASVPTTLTTSLGKVALSAKPTAVAAVISVVGGTLFGFPSVITRTLVGSAAVVALVLSAWFVQSSLNEKTDSEVILTQAVIEAEPIVEDALGIGTGESVAEEITELTIGSGSTPDTLPQSRPTSSAIGNSKEEVTKPDKLPIGIISGKLYDKIDFKPVPNATVLLKDNYSTAPDTIELATTDADGRFEFSKVSVGEYLIVPNPVQGYPKTMNGQEYTQVSFAKGDSKLMGKNVELNRGGVLKGEAVMNGSPLRNIAFRISEMATTPGNLVWTSDAEGKPIRPINLFEKLFGEIQTDGDGRFLVEGLPEFEGNLLARYTRPDGVRQDALHVVTAVRLNEETDVVFDFGGGSSAVQGTVYFGADKLPVPARMQIFFKWFEDGEYTDEIISFDANDRGEYFVDNLPPGDAELHAYVRGTLGDIERVVTVPLGMNETVTQDIYITETLLTMNVTGIPLRTTDLYIFAFPGEITVDIFDEPSLMYFRDQMVGLSRNFMGRESEKVATMNGLEPGTYTIHASAWPVGYEIAKIQAYGIEKFFEDMSHANKIITIEPDEEEIYLDLVFAPE